MPTALRTPKYWRERAAEARKLAESMSEPDSRRALLNVAENYEKIANRIKVRKAGGAPHAKGP